MSLKEAVARERECWKAYQDSELDVRIAELRDGDVAAAEAHRAAAIRAWAAQRDVCKAMVSNFAEREGVAVEDIHRISAR